MSGTISAKEFEIRENVYAITTAFSYNMHTKELIECLKGVLIRLKREYETDDSIVIDLIVSFLTLRYGDYGTSPRYGWFPNFERTIICDAIERRIHELEDPLRWEEEND